MFKALIAPRRRELKALCLVLVCGWQMSLLADSRLQIALSTANGPVQLTGTGPSNSVYRVERATDLRTWDEWLCLIPSNGSFRVQDTSFSGLLTRFYRFSTTTQTPADDWKNQAAFPIDPLLAADTADQVRWMKFLILANDPTRVYFQDSTKYVLHYDFAKARLPQFSKMSRTDFDAVSLYPTNQQAVLGSLLFPPGANVLEYGIQFAGQDPYPAEWVAKYFASVRQAVDAPAGTKAFYFPAFAVFNCEQTSAMADHRLKCWLTLQTRNVRLTDANLASCFYSDARFEYRLGGMVQTLTGSPSTWPSASHTVTETPSGRAVQDGWVVGSGSGTYTVSVLGADGVFRGF